jgi:hypothetical protein
MKHWRGHIMLRDLLTQKFVHKFLVTVFGIWIPQSMWIPKNQTDKSIVVPPPFYQLFSKCDFYFIKFAKIAKIDKN